MMTLSKRVFLDDYDVEIIRKKLILKLVVKSTSFFILLEYKVYSK